MSKHLVTKETFLNSLLTGWTLLQNQVQGGTSICHNPLGKHFSLILKVLISVFVLLLSIPIRKTRASTCRGDQRYQHIHCTQQKQWYDHKRLDFPNIYQLSANPSDMFEKCSNFWFMNGDCYFWEIKSNSGFKPDIWHTVTKGTEFWRRCNCKNI